MTRAVLSIGSNLGDRLARLQSAADGFGSVVTAVSGVYESEAWGGVDQGRFLNAVLLVDDPHCEAQGWLDRAQALERAADRVRGERWGPRTLDVDVIACYRTEAGPDGPVETEVFSHTDRLTLPHPLAHLRAFVLVPWLAVEPEATLTVAGQRCAVTDLLAELPSADRSGMRLSGRPLDRPDRPGWVLEA